jgi:hypothetical protein
VGGEGDDVRDHPAESEALRRIAQRVDEGIVPPPTVADLAGEREELPARRLEASLEALEGAVGGGREVSPGHRRHPHLLGPHEPIKHRQHRRLRSVEVKHLVAGPDFAVEFLIGQLAGVIEQPTREPVVVLEQAVG